ncbi:MAG: glycoside hydrolase family 36 protein [bacterium]
MKKTKVPKNFIAIVIVILFSFALNQDESFGEPITLASSGISISLNTLSGTYDLIRSDGSPVVVGAAAEAVMANSKSVSTRDMKTEETKIERGIATPLGTADALTAVFFHPSSGLELRMTFNLIQSDGRLVITSFLRSRDEKKLSLRRFRPMTAAGENGAGVFLGDSPADAQVLESGGGLQDLPVYDFYLRISKGDKQSDSNWNNCLYDRKAGQQIVSGFLTNRQGLTRVKTKGDGTALELAGRRAFSRYEALAYYQPSIPLPQGEVVEMETFYFDATTKDVFDTLEGYGRAVADWNGKTVWHNTIPMGWTSWCGGASSGGIGTSINEDYILQNLEAAARDFKKYGLEWFQVDAGYQITEGMWEANERFPHGMKWLADRIKEKGFRPGLWIAAFTHTHDSEVWKNHPDWFIKRSSFISSLIPKEWEYLDLSHPEAKRWIRDLFVKIVNDWGYEWIKLDFAYWAMAGNDYYDRTKTASEIYRDGLKIVRDILGPERFFLNVSVVGINWDTADAVRLNLDTPAWWEPEKDIPTAQSIKSTLRTAMRRYYFNHTVFINHNDEIFFREEDPRPEKDPKIGLTLNESRAFVSFIGLTGGIVKLGEPWTTMKQEWKHVLSRIMPVNRRSARPVDLFEMEWPETWVLDAQGPNGGRWKVAGLFNWGRNIDLTTGEEIPDAPRRIILPFKSVGMAGKTWLAYEFWNGTFIGELTDELAMTIPAHSDAIVSLREKSGVPQLLGSSRHITMGATDLLEERWDEQSHTLNLAFEGIEDEPFEIAVYTPDGYAFGSVTGGDSLHGLEWMVEGRVVKIQFQTTSRETIRLRVVFLR